MLKFTLISDVEIKKCAEEFWKEDSCNRLYVESRGHWEDIVPAMIKTQRRHTLNEVRARLTMISNENQDLKSFETATIDFIAEIEQELEAEAEK